MVELKKLMLCPNMSSASDIIAMYISSAKRNDFVDRSHDRPVATQGSKGQESTY